MPQPRFYRSDLLEEGRSDIRKPAVASIGPAVYVEFHALNLSAAQANALAHWMTKYNDWWEAFGDWVDSLEE
jgi:hypothetical protein